MYNSLLFSFLSMDIFSSLCFYISIICSFISSILRTYANPTSSFMHYVYCIACLTSPHPIPLYLAFDDIFSYISSPDRCFPPSPFLLFLHS